MKEMKMKDKRIEELQVKLTFILCIVKYICKSTGRCNISDKFHEL